MIDEGAAHPLELELELEAALLTGKVALNEVLTMCARLARSLHMIPEEERKLAVTRLLHRGRRLRKRRVPFGGIAFTIVASVLDRGIEEPSIHGETYRVQTAGNL